MARRVADRRCERTIARLEREGWTVTPQQRRAGTHRPDLLLSGPAGVYLVEMKTIGGRLEVDSDGMAVSYDRDRTMRTCGWLGAGVSRSAAELRAGYSELHPGWVRPVVAIWGDFPAGVVEGERVTFVAGERLRSWLGTQPQLSVRVELPARARRLVPAAR